MCVPFAIILQLVAPRIHRENESGTNYFQGKSKEVRPKLAGQLFLPIFTPRFLQKTSAALATQKCMRIWAGSRNRASLLHLECIECLSCFSLIVREEIENPILRIMIKNLSSFQKRSLIIYLQLKIAI